MKREEQCEAVIPEKNGKPEYRCPRPVVREGVCGMHFNVKQRAAERDELKAKAKGSACAWGHE